MKVNSYLSLAGGLLVWSIHVLNCSGAPPDSDAEITWRVEQTLGSDVRFRSIAVNVSTRLGSVTLQGEVATFLKKLEIERAVKRVRGVRGVINRIEVRRATHGDSQIAEKIERRLKQHSFIRPEELTVTVDNGRVVLQGNVDTWAQSRQAERTAREVDGVRQVHNELRTAVEPLRPDSQIQQDVKSAFARNLFLSDFPIQVAVRKGEVLLEGSIQNLFLWERAADEARLVPGVKHVENMLEVTSTELSPELVGLQEGGDERLRERVYREFESDPRVESKAITVSVRSRVVTLSGQVPTMFQRQLAWNNARNVLGVMRVENELAVEAEPRDDEEIRQDVESALASDSSLTSANIGVQVSQATVTLSGDIQNFSSRLRASRVVGRIRGVSRINNELTVPWATRADDAALAKRISERLLGNAQTWLAAPDIQVTAKAGVITLSGHVARWSEWREAERVARLTDGVRSVDNQLVVGR